MGKGRKNTDDAPKISTGADLSSVLVAARRSLLSEDRGEKSGSAQPEVLKLIARFPGSFKEASESFIQHGQKHHCQGVAGSHHKEDGRIGNKDPKLLGYGSKGHKIYYSGPLIVPSGIVYQMLKDHELQVEEAVRRAHVDKAKVRKVHVEGNQLMTSLLFVSGCCAGSSNPPMRPSLVRKITAE